MSTTTVGAHLPVYHHRRRISLQSKPLARASFPLLQSSLSHGRRLLWNSSPPRALLVRSSLPFRRSAVRASSSVDTAVAGTFGSRDLDFSETFPLNRTIEVKGKIFIKLDKGKDGNKLKLCIGCDLPGKWILHWGVSYIGDTGNEWDQPPKESISPDSINIKDYAVQTPFKKKKSSSGDETCQEVEIDIDPKSDIAGIYFVLKDEETGVWYKNKGSDFKVPLVNGQKKGSSKWPGLKDLSSMLFKAEASGPDDEDIYKDQEEDEDEDKEHMLEISPMEGFQQEIPIVKEVAVSNSVTVSVSKCLDTANNLLSMETDLPGNVIVHWGVSRDDANKWEVPATLPPFTQKFKNKALRTLLQAKEGGNGSSGMFSLHENYKGFLFVLKKNENSWFNCNGDDFHVPLPFSAISTASSLVDQPEKPKPKLESDTSLSDYANGVIGEMKNLVTDISDKTTLTTKDKRTQAEILQEIEKLAAEAYNIFRSSSVKTPPAELESDYESSEDVLTAPSINSGTGTGFEILCQGFNWESHKSGRWYMDIKDKAKELAALGFTIIWLPPPTDSVSPEGYMPKDLYNLNSRYGSMVELKDVVSGLRDVGIKVLGDVVLNHRCADKQDENGIWNKFGGRLDWDARAIVADDPHFHGKGNKSSGENFHAAPNIDHSQEFVRKDIKEWLCWLREEIGYDGWRLDFVRGFWGGYVDDYLEASKPYFAVGELWDSLSYTYDQMDHNQDAHRQRIIDWINATGGKACAFDVTTKGILHAALDRCEYWRLSDAQGKPPGVLGWWPSRAVTFIENHDTGSTQGHWRFPRGKEMQGYAYILTHPGTPSVFYDHIFSHSRSEIAALISVRQKNKINCRSSVKITKAERDVYAAIIDNAVAVKIGPGHYEPEGRWSKAAEGNEYKVWVVSS